MTTALAERPLDAATIEQVLLGGDLSKLTPTQRLHYYRSVCESVGLNPLTRPLQYLQLSGKLVLYATRDATDQLRKRHGVSVSITARELVDEIFVVTARAKNADGREDESVGAVPLGALKGEAKANAMMKAETKAKRRVTLSICGLGMLDETEVTTIADAEPVAVNPATGEIVATSTPPAEPKAPLITGPQAGRMYRIAKDAGWGEEGYRAFLVARGYPHPTDVTREDYTAVCATLEIGPTKPAIEKDVAAEEIPF